MCIFEMEVKMDSFSQVVIKVFALTFCLFLGSCSSAKLDPETIQKFEGENVRSVELFYSRSSFSETEFEQFKYIPGNLYRECGHITRGRFLPEFQGFVPVPKSDVALVQKRVAQIAAQVQDLNPSYDLPGKSKGMFDPGQYILTIRYSSENVQVRTALDSVTEPKNNAEKSLASLAETFRRLGGGMLCGNTDFYGLRFER